MMTVQFEGGNKIFALTSNSDRLLGVVIDEVPAIDGNDARVTSGASARSGVVVDNVVDIGAA